MDSSFLRCSTIHSGAPFYTQRAFGNTFSREQLTAQKKWTPYSMELFKLKHWRAAQTLRDLFQPPHFEMRNSVAEPDLLSFWGVLSYYSALILKSLMLCTPNSSTWGPLPPATSTCLGHQASLSPFLAISHSSKSPMWNRKQPWGVRDHALRMFIKHAELYRNSNNWPWALVLFSDSAGSLPNGFSSPALRSWAGASTVPGWTGPAHRAGA